MKLAENPRMTWMRNSLCAHTLYESEILTSLLNNSSSWIGITDEIINKLQEFQNRFLLRFSEDPKRGTETGIVDYNR